MRRSPAWLTIAGLVLAVVVLGLWAVPSESYLLLPDRAKPLQEAVDVEGEKPDGNGGGIFYVDIIVRRATLLERFVPRLRNDGELVPSSAIIPPGVTEGERREQSRRQMSRSQEIAAAVALRALGYEVEAKPIGALIAGIVEDAPAAGKLRPTDVIVAVDGEPVRGPGDLRRLIGRREPGRRVQLTVLDGKRTRRVTLRTIADRRDRGRALIGVFTDRLPAAEITLPLDVDIDVGRVGGPSAGLAFALDVVDELGRDVDRGYNVAATGEIELDGVVAPIGGVEQKVIGARRSGVDVFLVPAGENAAAARRHARNLRIIPVRTFQQALRELATLPRKRVGA